MTYELIPGAPSVADYRRLREVTGLSPKTEEAAKAGLPNSWFAVTVHQAGRVVGMGRVIGDGGTAFQITDIAVEPEHQGKGLGKQIMAALMACQCSGQRLCEPDCRWRCKASLCPVRLPAGHAGIDWHGTVVGATKMKKGRRKPTL